MPIDMYSLLNLKNNHLFYGFPVRFNDPYDSNVPINFKDESLSRLKKHKKENLPGVDIGTDKYMDLVTVETERFLKRFQQSQQKMGICCFSEKNNNILMWSHYALKHQGMCLEFDTECPNPTGMNALFSKLKDVKYKSDIPELDRLNCFDGKFNDTFVHKMFSLKSKDWSYEKEWRSFLEHGGKCYEYPVNALKAVYFGIKADDELIKLVRLIRPNIAFYRGRESETQFKVEFDLIE